MTRNLLRKLTVSLSFVENDDSWDTLQHTATNCNTMPHTATHCTTLHHTTTHCTTPQHPATHCTTLHYIAYTVKTRHMSLKCTAHKDCSAATHCNTLQHTAANCSTLHTKTVALNLFLNCMRLGWRTFHRIAARIFYKKKATWYFYGKFLRNVLRFYWKYSSQVTYITLQKVLQPAQITLQKVLQPTHIRRLPPSRVTSISVRFMESTSNCR